MKKKEIDYIIIGPTKLMSYLSGIITTPDERLQLYIISRSGEQYFIMPQMYNQLFSDNPDLEKLYFYDDDDDPAEIIRDNINCNSAMTIAVDDKLNYENTHILYRIFNSASFILASEITKTARMLKDEMEIKRLKESARIADVVAEEMFELLNSSLSEREIAFEIEFRLKKNNADKLAFSPIVASGENSALPHHNPTNKKISTNELVTMDFGGISQEYCSDITRTICIGNANKKRKSVYEIVRKAQYSAIEKVKPGIRCSTVDDAARNIINDAGYGEFFIHRTGHGIGMEYHEEPYIVAGNDTVLQKGMVFSIEPGIYIPNEFGVRIEDIVVVTKEGCEVLNKVPKKLIML